MYGQISDMIMNEQIHILMYMIAHVHFFPGIQKLEKRDNSVIEVRKILTEIIDTLQQRVDQNFKPH